MSPKSEKSADFASKDIIYKYTKLIEEFLKKEDKPFSEPHIAERVFGIKIRKEGNLPSSKQQLVKLSQIKDALKILVKEKKIFEALLEDPVSKEQVMHFSISGWYATP
jgi:hypothetical protein